MYLYCIVRDFEICVLTICREGAAPLLFGHQKFIYRVQHFDRFYEVPPKIDYAQVNYPQYRYVEK